LPLLKMIIQRIVNIDSAITIAQKTPVSLNLIEIDIIYVNGISISQKQIRFNAVGVYVSPAPLNACSRIYLSNGKYQFFSSINKLRT
jgi:hypothetical protein